MWNKAEDSKPRLEYPVIIAYEGQYNDIEYAIAEYIEEDFCVPMWRVYLDGENASITIDLYEQEVIYWMEFEFPDMDILDICERELKGPHINMILEQI